MIILKYIFFILIAFLTFVLVLNGYIYFYQDSFIFEYGKLNPEAEYKHGSNYEDVILKTEDGYLNKCWYMKAQGSEEKPVILYFLGNGGYIEGYIDRFNDAILNLEVDIFSCSNRGSGSNEGVATEKDFYKDAELYLTYLKKRNPPHIFVFGSSMGGAVAIDLSRKHQDDISGLIVQNTFLSLKKLSKHFYPFLDFFLINYDLIVKTKMNNESKIKEITIPTLFNISLMDKKIPPHHSKMLFKLCSSKHKFMYLSRQGTHSNVTKDGDGKYYESFKKFINYSIAIKEQEKRKKNQALTN